MPYTVRKRKGQRPWKILGPNGRQVGSSTSKRKAKASARIANQAHR